jgi:DNA topoisomerase I
MNVVVVESPAKAKTINKYLGPGYTVLASYGHIRDLPAKEGSVRPDSDFAMDWEIDAKARKHIDKIVAAVRDADHLYLATDPDREGEAISWHVQEVLNQKAVLAGVEVKRVVFNEITESAVQEAFANPRELNQELVEAYLARRALDYLVGFTLSPVLWRKLPGSRSAGRVQSVALRLICERELEIEAFNPQEYWSVEGTFATADGTIFSANLTNLNGTKLDRLSIADEAAAQAAVALAEARDFSVATVERKEVRRHPAPPFTTSTLQQEASRKLRFATRRTMQVAQKLYEGVPIGGETIGLITYMRTDGVQIAGEAIQSCRGFIGDAYGSRYVPEAPRSYRSKAKNAQEAHEAIRPTDIHRRPEDIAAHLTEEQQRLYELIWKRTVASQMESAILDQVGADIAPADRAVIFRATGSVVSFDGFFRLYQEGRDDSTGGNDDQDRNLPNLLPDQELKRESVEAERHETQPPPRFSEASLVKRLEELGIGRPSTYASIISVLQERDYVELDKRRFIPADRGRLVTAFLTSFFARYVGYDFTADLEAKLDEVSDGRANWKSVLHDFWGDFNTAIEGTHELRVRQVLDALNDLLEPHFFPATEGVADVRACKSCDDGRLSLKIGKFGAFIGCSNYPDCRFTRRLVANGDGEDGGDAGPRHLGDDPETGLPVTLRRGPYGVYVQLGEAEGKGKTRTKPKRASLPRGMEAASVTLETALALLALPREVGAHPESGEMIFAGIGRYGPYLRLEGVYISLKGDDDVLSIGLNRAVTVIAEAPKKAPAKVLGDHPADGKPVTQKAGRYGPYVEHGGIRANLPKDVEADAVTLEQALELIAAKAAKGGGKSKAGGKKASGRKPAARKGTGKGRAKKATAGS